MWRFLASRRFLSSSITTPATVNPLPSPSIMDGSETSGIRKTGSVLLIVINGLAEEGSCRERLTEQEVGL